jgi:hypothetical protein
LRSGILWVSRVYLLTDRIVGGIAGVARASWADHVCYMCRVDLLYSNPVPKLSYPKPGRQVAVEVNAQVSIPHFDYNSIISRPLSHPSPRYSVTASTLILRFQGSDRTDLAVPLTKLGSAVRWAVVLWGNAEVKSGVRGLASGISTRAFRCLLCVDRRYSIDQEVKMHIKGKTFIISGG